MPDGLYLRLIRAERTRNLPGSQEQMLARVLSHGYARIYLTDYFRELGETVRMAVTMHATQLIELTPDWEPPDAKVRSEIRKAEREGVTIEKFDASKHLDGFLDLMKATDARHGRKQKYPDQFFAALAGLASQDERVRWYYASHDGRPVVSHIYFVEGETALNWQIYYDKQFSSLKGNQLMLYRAAQQLRSEGVRFLSMGATPGDAEGVKIFKEKWGGITATYPCFEHRSLIGRLI
jgi:lipid II:glycine glycyltransferase (peptidoglycan interpeptide bridge formation enzyme)